MVGYYTVKQYKPTSQQIMRRGFKLAITQSPSVFISTTPTSLAVRNTMTVRQARVFDDKDSNNDNEIHILSNQSQEERNETEIIEVLSTK